MATQLAKDYATGPLGTFRVSTIQTFSGGGEDSSFPGIPLRDSDYVDETTWPFETMVFAQDSSKGLYHAPYATKEEALAGHALMVKTIREGLEFGGGVTEDAFGTPTITPEEWAERSAGKRLQKI